MSAPAKRSVTITLDGSNKSTRLPLLSGSVGTDVFDIRKLYGDLGVFTYDPGYGATASCRDCLQEVCCLLRMCSRPGAWN